MLNLAKRDKLRRGVTVAVFLSVCFLCFSPVPLHAGVTNETRPEIYCEFSSSQGPIDKSRVKMWVDGRDVTAEATIESWNISYRPAEPLAPGKHRVRVEVYDILGSRGVKTWTFTIAPEAKDTSAPKLKLMPPTPANGEVLHHGSEIEIAALVEDEGGSGIDTGAFQFELVKDGRQLLVSTESFLFKDGMFKASLGQLEPGRYSVRLSASDLAENPSEPAGSAFSIVSDSTARPAAGVSGSLMDSLEQPRARRKGSFYIDDLPETTDTPRIDVTGRAPSGEAVELLLNGIPVRQDFAEPSGDFVFSNVQLSEGENFLAAAISSDEGFPGVETDEQMVLVDTSDSAAEEEPEQPEEEPEQQIEVAINVPKDGQTFKHSPINVQGKAPAGAEASLLVNGSEVAETTANPGGVFHFKKVQLTQGQNTLQAVANVDGTEYESESITVSLQEK